MGKPNSSDPSQFSFLRFAAGIEPFSSPEERQAAAAEIFDSQVSAQRGGVLIQSRPGLPLPGFSTRDMVAGSPTAGGNLATDGVAPVVAAARPQTVLERLGAVRIETGGDDLVVPIWTGENDFASSWLPESGAAPNFDQLEVKTLTLVGHGVGSRLGFSRKIEKQVANVEASVLAEMGRAVAVTLERGFIAGSGSSNQPLGLLNVGGTTKVAMAGSLPTRTEMAAIVSAAAVAKANLDRAHWLVSSADFASLLDSPAVAGQGDDALIEYGDGAFRALGFPVTSSAFVPNGTVLFGDFSTCRTSFHGPPMLVADRYSSGRSITGAVQLVLINWVDFGMIEPTHIVLSKSA